MTKKMIKQRIDAVTYDLEGTLDEAIKFLQETKKIYPNAVLEWAESAYNDGYTFYLCIEREETDEEYANRLHIEKVYTEKRREHEENEYKRLKAIYGDKS